MSEATEAEDSQRSDAQRKNSSDFLIVGMGGSAGAITAFREFFRNVPPASGMAYVVILHLSPDHDSHLAEVLQHSTDLPVTQLQESVRIQPDHIYVISPNKSLTMSDGMLVLSDVTGFEERRAPVDLFFRTLAEEHDSRAVCVILSGTGADGSMGMKRVKENNGLVLVQDPSEAEFADMPRNSIATGLVDHIVPVATMPPKIIAYRDRVRAVALGAPEHRPTDENALTEIFAIVRARTGHDFTNYKRPTVMRRIQRRIGVNELEDLAAYTKFLRDHRQEAEALLKDLLISVTNFFRDPAVFEVLQARVIPELFDGKGTTDQVRVWVPACATGEEAYTIAMLLHERHAKTALPPSLQLFATDLDEASVAQARHGYYTLNDVADVSPERLRRFFVKEQEGFRVRRELRETVLFAHHNLIKDPPFSHLDLVSCRNLLIYLNRAAQERVMDVVHFALKPGGYLLLGTSETPEAASHLFSIVDKDKHIYQSRSTARSVAIALPRASPLADFSRSPGRPPQPSSEASASDRRLQERVATLDLHQQLLEQYAAPSIVVNESHDIIHLTERAGRYMQFAAGEASLNLLKVIRPELRMELRTALYRSAQARAPIEAHGLAVYTDRSEKVNITVRPVFRETSSSPEFFLVLFEETQSSTEARSQTQVLSATEPAALLEEEVLRLRSQMRMTVEQYETQAEEFKAANEELQAINEELRSTSEELEISKEEVQSVNEELHTVNQELKVKIEELSHANDDMRNLMSSTEIGTIFLDRALQIKLFTPRARDIFKLIAADTGRPLLDIASNLVKPAMIHDLERVLDRSQTVEREVETADGRWHLMQLVPYRARDERVDGVVATFVDITARKNAEDELRKSREELEGRVIARTAELNRASAMLQTLLDEKAKLLRKIVETQEEERQRIARELHDEMGQHLIALKVGLASLAAADKGAVERLTTLAGRIDDSIDRLTLELRPTVLNLGLPAALRHLTEEFSKISGVHIDLQQTAYDEDSDRLDETLETMLYRIAQEALTNVSRHAAPKTVSVIFERREDHVVLIIEDDGSGFDPSAELDDGRPHLGLLGIRERAALVGGTVTVESRIGGGTTIFIRVPI
jgi:two-component system CheB/CheR fusion protein